ncbi:hypothetical protein MMC22_006415 [Lobaria immixta]|nr:hypothetical protein [Lobaria immixta]
MAIEEYVYYPLADGCARFMEVFSDTTDAPLRCRIFASQLNEAPPYEALSYAWGPQEPLHDLQCSSVPTRVLRIGPNQKNALLSLRFDPAMNPNPRILWVDRICINQDDVKERASQVLLMHSIFRRYQQALVWLGQEDQNTKDAFDCAHYIFENGLGEREIFWKSLAQFKSPPVAFAKLKDTLRSLAQLSYRPWFERAWTFQEAVLPSKTSLVCGKNSMHLKCLETCLDPACEQARAFFSGNAQLVFSTRETFLESPRQLPPDDFERLLSFRRHTKASNPRDIIFSLLGLFSPSVSLSLSPDYSTSVKDLFTAVAILIMRESGELRILCLVESPKHLRGEAFPGWVPDWRASPESYENVLHDRNPRSGYQATRGSVLTYDPSPDANELHLYGILIGTVTQAGRMNDFHAISDFYLPDRYTHTNQPITTALRQAQTLNFDLDVGHVIQAGDSQRRILAAFFDLPIAPRLSATSFL